MNDSNPSQTNFRACVDVTARGVRVCVNELQTTNGRRCNALMGQSGGRKIEKVGGREGEGKIYGFMAIRPSSFVKISQSEALGHGARE